MVEAKGVNEMEVEIREQLEDSAKEERLEWVKQRKEQWLEKRRMEDNKLKPYKKSFIATKKVIKHKIKNK